MASTSDPNKWHAGMTYISPITGKATNYPANMPYSAEQAARAAMLRDLNQVATYTEPAATVAPSGTYGATKPKASSSGASSANAAAAAARTAASNAARSSANQQKSALQQAIDAALAQRQTNQSKLDALGQLVASGLAAGRDTGLKGVDLELKTLLDQAMANYQASVGDLNTGLRDNEKSESDSSFGNLANRAREKQDLVAEALANGAGESDILKTQLQALRNWSSNQGEINRSYFDTLTSTNSAITDLNVGTKSNMTGAEMEANQRRAGIWSDFYAGQADAYTQMDNLATNNYLLDQEIAANQANIGGQDALLAWLASGKSADSFVAPVTATAGRAAAPYTGFAQQAAAAAGSVWQNPGVSQGTLDWKGEETRTDPLNTSNPLNAATNVSSTKKPEGAGLRRW